MLSSPQISLALIHNSTLPHPLSTFSTHIAAHALSTLQYSSTYPITLIDLASYSLPISSALNIPVDEASGFPSPPSTPTKTLQDWKSETEQHAGYILLFPYHVWALCKPLKEALGLLDGLERKPVLINGFGKEIPFHCPHPGREWRKKSFEMIRKWLAEKGMRVLELEGGWEVEFTVHGGDWEYLWAKGRGWIGGQQSEEWERVDGRCREGIRGVVDILESRRGG